MTFRDTAHHCSKTHCVSILAGQAEGLGGDVSKLDKLQRLTWNNVAQRPGRAGDASMQINWSDVSISR